MLSVNYIANFLNKDQKQINNRSYNYLKNFEINNENEEIVEKLRNNYKNSIKESYVELHECFEDYFEKEYFGLNKEENRNKNNVFTFFSAIFGIGDESYYLLTDQEKSKCIKNLIHLMDNEIISKNLYNEFKYDKNKHFSKEKILTVLKESFNFRNNEYFNLLIKYVSDYLGINIYFFEVKNSSIINNYMIESFKYTDSYNKYLPLYFIIKENNEYIPIMIKNKLNVNYVLNEDIYKIKDIIETKNIIKDETKNITKDETKKDEDNQNINFKKMKVDELRNYCIEKNINIYKKSEKTGKDIKRTKDELLNELN
jgi:hypothetical protein